MLVITPDAWRAQPWKNGRGVTHEVLRLPDVDNYDLRISVARVTESGPFSTFPGYTRWSLLDGGPIQLAGHALGMVELDGGAQFDAIVGGAATLLNIIGRGVRIGDGGGIVFERTTRETHVLDPASRVVTIR